MSGALHADEASSRVSTFLMRQKHTARSGCATSGTATPGCAQPGDGDDARRKCTNSRAREADLRVAAATAFLALLLARLRCEPKAEGGTCCYRTPMRFAQAQTMTMSNGQGRLPSNGFKHSRADEQARRQHIHSSHPDESRFIAVQVDERPKNELCCGADERPGSPGHSIEDGHVLAGEKSR